jgi:hypothetical protein
MELSKDSYELWSAGANSLLSRIISMTTKSDIENTKVSYTLLVEQEAMGQWWWVSGPPGLLVAGATLAAALSLVPDALIDLAIAKSIGGSDDH